MKAGLSGAVCIFLSMVVSAPAHRLDEYLQATIVSVEKNRIHAEINLTPGIAVAPAVLREMDTDGDGVISNPEQRAYAQTVLQDLSFAAGGDRLNPHVISILFPAVEEMRAGTGEIRLVLEADLPPGARNRTLTFENHHDFRIAAYIVNCLVPRDPGIRIIGQSRNYSQSFYRLDFVDMRAAPGLLHFGFLRGADIRELGTGAFLLLACLTLIWRRTPRLWRARR